MKSRSLRPPAASILLSSIAITLCSAGSAWSAAVAVQNITFGGSQETVIWEAGRLSAGAGAGRNVPSSGSGTIAPGSPGYSATNGYYSWGGDYSITATTSIQDTSVFSDIQNVVFQYVAMGSSEALLAFGGGPVISLYNGSTPVPATVPVTYSAPGPGVPGSGGGFDGTYSASMFQWDLSGITEPITAISIQAPIWNHGSVIESRIDIGGGRFQQAIPEPGASFLGLSALGLLSLKRRRPLPGRTA